jgi:outer membrane protein
MKIGQSFLKISLFTMLVPLVTHAQNNTYSLQKCIETALKNNVQANITRRSNDIYDVSLTQARNALYPSLNGNASQGFSFGKSLDPGTYQYVNQNIASNVFSLTSSFVLFEGGQLKNVIRQDQQLVEAGKMDVKTFENTITIGVAGSYLQVLLDNELVNIAQAAISRDQKQIDITKVMVKAGSVPELNLYQVQSQLATDQLTLTNAQNQRTIDRLTLEQLMNIPDAPGFDIEKPQLPDPYVITDSASSAALYAQSVELQPQVKSTEMKIQAAIYAYEVAHGAQYPRLLLNSNITTNYTSTRDRVTSEILYRDQQIGYLQSNPSSLVYGIVPYTNISRADYPFFGQLKDNISEGFTFSLSIPIFNNYIVRANMQQAIINRDIARLNDQYTHEQFRKTIEQSYTDMAGGSRQFSSAKEVLRTETEAYNIMELKYKNGAANASDLIIETNKFSTAQSQVAQAKYNFIFKKKILDFYLGKSILL